MAAALPWKPAGRTTAVDDGSDSDDSGDSYCPKQEPEFVIHFVDEDHHRPPPPAPAPAPARRPNLQLAVWPPSRGPRRRPNQLLRPAAAAEFDRRERKLDAFFAVEMVHFFLVAPLALATGMLADSLPKEYTEGVGELRVILCMCIGFTAFSLLVVFMVSREDECNTPDTAY